MAFDIEAIRARTRARRDGSTHDHAACEEDIDAVLAALDAAIRDIEELRRDNEDLRASATLWADLYEASLDREALRQRELLEAIAVLREALEWVLRECAACMPRHTGEFNDFPLDEFCARCAKAAAALRRSAEWSRCR